MAKNEQSHTRSRLALPAKLKILHVNARLAGVDGLNPWDKIKVNS
jgi:hypothetical protein